MLRGGQGMHKIQVSPKQATGNSQHSLRDKVNILKMTENGNIWIPLEHGTTFQISQGKSMGKDAVEFTMRYSP